MTHADPRTAAPLAPSPLPPDPPRTLVRTWLLAVGGLGLAKLLSYVDPTGILGGNLAGVAAFLFIALPDKRLRARHESWSAYGALPRTLRDARTWRAIGRGAWQGVLVCAVVFPVFGALFWAYSEVLPYLPGALARVIAPYGFAPRLAFRLPDRVLLLALVQLLVVAVPEELFYRGWMQTSWARSNPERGVTILGARLGAGFVRTQALFALGHLVVLEPWRMATFLPGLLFGWVRERTGGLVAPVVVHALSNLFIATLEASWYGR